MKILSMKFSPSSSQKPNKFALQPIKTCKTFEHFQLGFSLEKFIFNRLRNSRSHFGFDGLMLKLKPGPGTG